MATLVLRNIKGSPLSNTEVDNNFQNLNNALGAAGSTTIPTPTGTGSPVLNTSPTISTNLFCGSQANTTRFPYAFASISSVTGGANETTTYIGLISEAKGSGSYDGVGLYGVGYATGALRGTGVQGEGHVSLTGDTASAIGVRGYSNDTHSGGMNVGLFGDASGSTIGNYALYMNSGDIGSTGTQSWILGGNLSFTGAYSVNIPTLNVTKFKASNINYPTSDGTNGQVISTDGAGNLTFTTPVVGISLSNNNTWAGTQSFTGTSSKLAEVLTNAGEVCTVSATAATGTINFDVTSQSVLYYTSNASANWTVNFRGSSGTSLNTLMSTGQSVTVAFMVTQGSTAYYNNAVTIDGVSVTPKYQGGTDWSTGNASSIDAYVYTIIKTGSATFTVLASQTKYA